MGTNRDRALDLLRGMLALLCVVFPLVLAAVVVAGEGFLADLVFPAIYAERTAILWLLLLAMLFTGLYTIAYPLYYYDLRTRRILAITAFSAVANLVLSVVFIRAWGAEGAAGSFFLTMMVTTWIYLAAYRDWVDGRSLTLLAVVTIMIGGAAILLLVTRSVWPFVGMLLATSIVAWMLGRTAARPIVRNFVESIRLKT